MIRLSLETHNLPAMIICQYFILIFSLISNVQIGNACAMFTKEDPKDRKFAFLHCWNILKDKPKWMDRRKEIGCAKKKQAIKNRRQ